MGKKSGGGTTTQIQQPMLPDWLQNAMMQNINIADQLASRPYQPYTGNLVADFTDDQKAAFDMARNNIGAGQDWLGQAANTAQGLSNYQAQQINPGDYMNYDRVNAGQMQQARDVDAGQMGRAGNVGADQVSAGQMGNVGHIAGAQGTAAQTAGQDLSAYMNPYTQNVIDPTMAELRRQQDMTLQGVGDSAQRSGAFGGSRHGIAEAESNRAFADVAARTLGDLQSRGHEQALAAAQQDTALRQQSGLANQQAAMQAALANQGVDLQRVMAEYQGDLQAGLANQDANLRAALANQGVDMDRFAREYQGNLQAGMANQQADMDRFGREYQGNLQSQMANQSAGLQANQLGLSAAQGNQQADLSGAGIRMGGANQLAGFGNQLQGMMNQDLATMLGIGGMQQDQGQRGLDSDYQQYLRQQQYPIDMFNLRLAAMSGQPVQSAIGQMGSSTAPSQRDYSWLGAVPGLIGTFI